MGGERRGELGGQGWCSALRVPFHPATLFPTPHASALPGLCPDPAWGLAPARLGQCGLPCPSPVGRARLSPALVLHKQARAVEPFALAGALAAQCPCEGAPALAVRPMGPWGALCCERPPLSTAGPCDACTCTPPLAPMLEGASSTWCMGATPGAFWGARVASGKAWRFVQKT